jgi:hypothetical protein
MLQRMTMGTGLSLCIVLLTLHAASGQNAERRSQGPSAPTDAVANAQTPRVVQGTRPEQRQTAHDRSTVFGAPPAPPLYSEAPTSEFFRDAQEVYDTGTTLTPEQQTIAQYWADGPGMTGTPAGHWIAIVGQVVTAHRLSLMAAAEAYARVGIAIADAFIASWHTKYVYNLVRPVTYIRDVIDPAWAPFLVTPPFPEYTSGHSVQSGAAATVLTDLFGEVAFTDTTHADHGLEPALAPRTFPSFQAAAAEAAISRLYGGIHFRPAIERGLEQGACVGQKVLEQVHFWQ